MLHFLRSVASAYRSRVCAFGPRVEFFVRCVHDARYDPFFGIGWVHAFFWTIRHWKWLNSPEGPYAE